FVDADHINLSTVDKYIEHSDFFTIDVADYIGKIPPEEKKHDFMAFATKYTGDLQIPGIGRFHTDKNQLSSITDNYLNAVLEAAKIYRHIEEKKGKGTFIPEVSMDEVANPQTPVDLFYILLMLSMENVPVQTIAPKFSGRFNKGVDYSGDIIQFEKEFEEDLLVINYAIERFQLPENLKLSVHSGSDKFSIYPVIGKLIRKYDRGIHVKTAGTTWLEEVIGLALSGGEALELAKNIYKKAYARFDELCIPYATVIDINKANLPSVKEIDDWNGEKFANTLRHDLNHPEYNADFRQLIHVGYKIAAEYANIYIHAVNANKEIVEIQVMENIYDRHLKSLFDL
ncbi:MAG: tagaturonate epimerase family protein, partial [Bacteroidota bacterium]